jgi:hypothetical protein
VHRKTQSLDRTRAQLRKSLRCVNIVIEGTGGVGQPNQPGGGGGDPDLACFNTPSNLARFCLMLLEFQELKALRFTARWQNREWRADPLQARYLCITSLKPYLSLLTNLTSLDLDLCGTDIAPDLGLPVHFCPHLRPLLSRLTSLRLRLRSICHLALWPLDGQPVTLAQLSLSLYLGRVSDYNPKLNASRSCSSPGWIAPLDEMRSSMKALVKVMAEPRRAEMVHLAPSGEVHVWDASTEVCVRDWSERPRTFHWDFGLDPKRPCFSEGADEWPWDGEGDADFPYTIYGPGGFLDHDGSDGSDRPDEVGPVDEYFDFDEPGAV